jgi:hypothetical protein
MRINCSSANLAMALAETLMGEGHTACWLVSYDTGRPQVVTDAPRDVVTTALGVFGLGAI